MNPQANQKCLPFCPLDRGDQAGFILDLPSGFGYLRVKQRSAVSDQLSALSTDLSCDFFSFEH